jgi:hypothetical protein
MDLKITLNNYSRQNVLLDISKDLKKAWAESYEWWVFVETDSVGNVFFNDSTYSNTTSSQQCDTRSILRRLGVRVHFTIYNTTEHFGQSIEHVLKASIKNYKTEIKKLIKAIKKKGSWKRTNAERRAEIKSMLYKIKDARNIKNNYLNKKLIPLKKKSLKEHYTRHTNAYRNENGEVYNVSHYRSSVKENNTYKKYFKKQNGKLNRNGFVEFLNKKLHTNTGPESIDKIKELLKFKGSDSIENILLYQFSNDLNNMIPDIDSSDYKKLLSKIKSYKIDKNTLTTMDLDKIHTYLTNKINRKSYNPREVVPLKLSPEILRLETLNDIKKDLILIKTDQDLRREGRQQGHCIGSKSYMNQVLMGYQALRFKDHTFFLSPENKIIEAHGRHNTYTPTEIKTELEKLISA